MSEQQPAGTGLGRQDWLMLYGTVATTGAAVMMLERMGPMLLAF